MENKFSELIQKIYGHQKSNLNAKNIKHVVFINWRRDKN